MNGLRHRILALAALVVSIAGCADSPVTVLQPVNIRSHVGRDLIENVAKYGALPTVVLGNPFGGSESEFSKFVTETMKGANFGQELVFTTTPSPDNRSPYRVIVLFNPAPSARSETICENLNQPLAARKSGVKVMMVLCTSEYPVASTSGRRGGISGVNDPGFRALVRATTRELFPSKLYDINSPDRRRRS